MAATETGLALVAGVSAIALLAGLRRALRVERALARLARHAGAGKAAIAPGDPMLEALQRLAMRWAAPMGRRLIGQGASSEQLALSLRRAGFLHPAAPSLFAIGRLGLALAAGLLASRFDGLVPGPGLFVLGALGTAFLASRLLAWRAEAAAGARRAELPAAIGLMVLGLEGGAGTEQALRFAAQQAPAATPALAPAMRLMLQELDGGTPQEQALTRLSHRLAIDDAATLAELVRQSLRFGTELIQPLRGLAVDLGEQRLAQAREKVGSAAVKLTVVMVAAFLPALLILMGAPALSGLMAGMTGDPR
ncbi:type II secretion system F family protein [Roseomonas sp. 18066]|uniref:type II secretion system F family protein n=1 Tax=Roseomonas sp. 18066 TaxID=2681412 RepID=UPI00135B02FC|nr:type II secretion system F family protein [Roseomonas sp. 18066]